MPTTPQNNASPAMQGQKQSPFTTFCLDAATGQIFENDLPVQCGGMTRLVDQANKVSPLVDVLALVLRGCQSGGIKSKPLLHLDPKADQLAMQSLEEIVKTALKQALKS